MLDGLALWKERTLSKRRDCGEHMKEASIVGVAGVVDRHERWMSHDEVGGEVLTSGCMDYNGTRLSGLARRTDCIFLLWAKRPRLDPADPGDPAGGQFAGDVGKMVMDVWIVSQRGNHALMRSAGGTRLVLEISCIVRRTSMLCIMYVCTRKWLVASLQGQTPGLLDDPVLLIESPHQKKHAL